MLEIVCRKLPKTGNSLHNRDNPLLNRLIMNEIWKDVVDYEGIFEISNLGNFRRNPSNPYKAKYPKFLNRLGYEYVSIQIKGKKSNRSIHQLVAGAFIPNFVYGMHLNHIDGIKNNNNLTNLELSNPTHNNTHSYTLSTTSKPGKSKYRNVSVRIDKRNKTNTALSQSSKISPENPPGNRCIF